MSAGIDYGMGTTNINHETGIRYGVISQHDVSQAWCESAEPIYPEHETACDDDGNEIESDHWDEPSGWEYNGDGYELSDCLDSDIMVLKSPFYTYAPFCSPCVPGVGNLDGNKAEIVATVDGEFMVLIGGVQTGDNRDRSGAGDATFATALEAGESLGVKTYCLGHDWFYETNAAPYPVYSVATGELVQPD